MPQRSVGIAIDKKRRDFSYLGCVTRDVLVRSKEVGPGVCWRSSLPLPDDSRDMEDGCAGVTRFYEKESRDISS